MFNILQARKRTIFVFIAVNRIIRDSKLQFRSRKEENFIIIVENIEYQSEDKRNDS